MDFTRIRIYKTRLEIEGLVKLFMAKRLPKERWTHEAHLTVGLWYVMHFGTQAALVKLRKDIKAYNETTGTKNSPSGGYHETITAFWIYVIDSYIKRNKKRPFSALVNQFLNSKYSDRKLPLQYYSRDILFSRQARAAWVTSDKRELEFL